MAEFLHPPELSIFQKPYLTHGVSKIQYVEYKPVSQPSAGSVMEFQVPGNGSQYLDLKSTRLQVKLQILKEDGTVITEEDNTALLAIPLHCLFQQVDLYLNQECVTSAHTLYPYKAYLDKILNTTTAESHPQHESELYIRDGNRVFGKGNFLSQSDPDFPDENFRNLGLWKRGQYTKFGRVVTLESPLHIDLAQQDRYILNNVDLGLRLYQSQDSFRLMTGGSQRYKVAILDATLRVSRPTVSPEILLAHADTLIHTPACYPYYKSLLKTFAVPRGQYSVTLDSPFKNIIPKKLFLCLISSAAYNGDFSRNALEFDNFEICCILRQWSQCTPRSTTK